MDKGDDGKLDDVLKSKIKKDIDKIKELVGDIRRRFNSEVQQWN